MLHEISIVIPLFNKERFIRRSLDSVFAQTFHRYEIIVINDGSQDYGADVVSSYDDRRLRLINQENTGPGEARNRGIREAKGRYIAFLDADDEWLPHYLESSYSILESWQSCDICLSAWYQDCVCGDKLSNPKSIIELYRDKGIEIKDGPVDCDTIGPENNLLDLWWTSTVFIRRKILDLQGYHFFSGKHYGEDFYLWLQLAFSHSVYRNCTPLAFYHNGSTDFARGLYRSNPVEAFLLWPEPILCKTVPQNRKKLRTWLAYYGLKSAHARLGAEQYQNALAIAKKHPRMIFVAPGMFFSLCMKMLLYKTGFYTVGRKMKRIAHVIKECFFAYL